MSNPARIALLFLSWLFGQRMLLGEELRLNSLFSDQAVLQQDVALPVWGMASPGAEVEVRLGDELVRGMANDSGEWMVVLAPQVGGYEERELVVRSAESGEIRRSVLIGEVWLAAGSSGMATSVEGSLAEKSLQKLAARVDDGEFSALRFFQVPIRRSETRSAEADASWEKVGKEMLPHISATAFHFGSHLAQGRNVPVGVMVTCEDGTSLYPWMFPATFFEQSFAEGERARWSRLLEVREKELRRIEEKRGEERGASRQEAESLLAPYYLQRPGSHYFGMIAPLQPFAMRGVIWEQRWPLVQYPFQDRYLDLMLALAADWRREWAVASNDRIAEREFPFYLVQLPRSGHARYRHWPLMREQALRFWREGSHTGMVVSFDRLRAKVKANQKQDKAVLGERLARFARGQAYGEYLVYSGPLFESMRVEENRAIVQFSHVGQGLGALTGEEILGFELAGADQVFHSAQAWVNEDELVVTSEAVPEPRAVRYAWSSDPAKANFGNLDGLPASPFRSDSWQPEFWSK